MLKITVDHDHCVECGNCEGHLPGILAAAKPGPWLVNTAAPHADHAAIERAVTCCPLELIKMEAL